MKSGGESNNSNKKSVEYEILSSIFTLITFTVFFYGYDNVTIVFFFFMKSSDKKVMDDLENVLDSTAVVFLLHAEVKRNSLIWIVNPSTVGETFLIYVKLSLDEFL